ncbi:rubrerythrin family protein [Fervidicoccus fontis]|uniref:Rubrerythrin n=2 Tax=Fervidicoccus fontis TaxID=683846 RepID=I0A1H4_FERFK|nr:rubrerythrin family protein [Fervidicoccus fontis]AFH42831.1 Rubrerythrin [Fervidicoccus fontis Kam940]MBE9391617.1 rubrerythrin family protein [Fervidicoccus fontis]PMB75984.1 MAG: Rubrerythrin-2 [Fervidicoccus fontis]PMB77871.1 MAG: Rubrerythrin-2 [Fervidicoccus fontis]HEW63567.1 rubrerythrin family protein [Fervidicoccus fontis]
MVRAMTKDALIAAFGGESMAHMRYQIFADIAEKEGFKNVSRLFRGIAYAEKVHASNHYNALREYNEDQIAHSGVPIGPGNTSKNLELAIRGEEFEVKEMYPVYIDIAKMQGENEALKSFNFALKAEEIHAELYKQAKKDVDSGKDFNLKGRVYVCPVCGYTYVGEEPPERCPICGAKREMFRDF